MKTLEKIENEVIDLLQTKPLKQITVQKVCHNLKISRTTFYVYFESIDSLVKNLSDDVLDDVTELFSQWQYLNFSQMLALVEDERAFHSTPIYRAYRYIWQRKKLFKVLIGPYAPRYFSQASYQLLVEMLTYLVEQNHKNSTTQLIYFCSGGIWSSLCHWVNYDTENVLPYEIAKRDLMLLSQLLLEEKNVVWSRG
ncbi:MAG: TetR/AcrR family transcriptional regulator [Liquorilactobacillus nagelii]|jgi:AcrR family transcriptional regulator|uniref:TetR/AcrR family transcriptional regulator n=1 Tax=Liquorilactobacillus nagelii TaxID=82688 RepID=UPI00242BB81E|nr:TetR/AcrR family transcriptional regulator [Liquorilactobacillus nagelii]MCI1632700.1 TetR/AcrR family transcriptional regulator [Liquorilactobacillus nagelii]